MCQETILKILKKNKNNWLCVNDIIKDTDININTVRANLRTLKKYEEVNFKVKKQSKTYYKYKDK